MPHWQLPLGEHVSARPSAVQSVQVPPACAQLVAESDVQTPPAQQPLGHELASHTQLPPVQREPAPHAGPPPHVQAPLVQPSAFAPQETHAPPTGPHALADVGETQLAPEQQPVGQVVRLQLVHTPDAHVPALHALHAAPPVPQALGEVPAKHVLPWQQPAHEVVSQTQVPATQRWPVAQAVPPPHEHAPADEQPSPRPLSVQSTQAAPLEPHVVAERAAHIVPEQQPEAHEVASHAHAPPTQRCPEPHGGPEPHAHAPRAQLSERPSQAMQAAPAVPHALVDGVAHVAPEQQPLAQLVALQLVHTPLAHVPPVPQFAHAVPPVPHAVALLPARQLVPLQQPLQEVASQTHAPPTQCWPAPQAGPVPQRQAPVASQALEVSGSQVRHCAPGAPHALAERVVQVDPAQQPVGHEVASQTHAPPTQRWPALHAAPPPQLQSPALEQASASVVSQLEHAEPSLPQLVRLAARQVVPSQQPLGQDVASHTHAPPSQRWPTAHIALPPHAQTPPEVQPSARVASQATHAAPAVPHRIAVGVLHVLPEQQPLAQVAVQAVQAPAVHAPPPQLSQLPPPLPHALGSVPGAQTSPLQQPLHDVPSHTHAPPTQCCPAAQAAPAPHRQSPDAQPSARSGSQA